MTVVTYKMKRFFFDRQAVSKAIGKNRARVLGRMGAFVQRRARSSLRRRKRTSSPGQTPSVHSSDSVTTLKNILFAYNPANESVIVGPAKLNGSGSIIGATVPALHEFGGTVGLRQRRRRGRPPRIKQATYPPRPFMGPALKAEAPKLASLWQGQVKP